MELKRFDRQVKHKRFEKKSWCSYLEYRNQIRLLRMPDKLKHPCGGRASKQAFALSFVGLGLVLDSPC